MHKHKTELGTGPGIWAASRWHSFCSLMSFSQQKQQTLMGSIPALCADGSTEPRQAPMCASSGHTSSPSLSSTAEPHCQEVHPIYLYIDIYLCPETPNIQVHKYTLFYTMYICKYTTIYREWNEAQRQNREQSNLLYVCLERKGRLKPTWVIYHPMQEQI